MLKTVTAQNNQSLPDMVVNEYGSMEAAMALAYANNMSISDIPAPGQDYVIPIVNNTAMKRLDVAYLRQNKIVIGTLQPIPLGLSIILRPHLTAVPNEVVNPHVLGYYSFDMIGRSNFIHTYGLADTYTGDNRLNYLTEERYIFEETPDAALPMSITVMSDKFIPYQLPFSLGLGYMLMWSNLSEPSCTFTYHDLVGNEAHFAPLIMFDNITQNVVTTFVGHISLEVVNATPTSVIVRATRSHPIIDYTNFATFHMDWLLYGNSAEEDPDNPDAILLTLSAGSYRLGLQTTYYYPLSTPPLAYPSSSFSLVFQIQ